MPDTRWIKDFLLNQKDFPPSWKIEWVGVNLSEQKIVMVKFKRLGVS